MNLALVVLEGREGGIGAYTHQLQGALSSFPELDILPMPLENDTIDCGGWLDCRQQYKRIGAGLNRADIIHLQHQYFLFGGVAPYRNFARPFYNAIRAPMLVTAHEVVKPHGSILRKAAIRISNRLNFTHPAITRLHVHTRRDRRILTEMRIPSSKITLEPHPIPDPQPLPCSARSAKSNLGLEGKTVLTLFGYLAPNKGHPIAIEALKSLPNETHLLLAGGPHPRDRTPYVQNLKQQIARSRTTDRVHITGYVPDDDMPVIMAASDLILAPYLTASGSGALSLAIAYGKPILASDIESHQEIAEMGRCFSIYSPNEPTALAEAVKQLLNEPSSLNALSKAAQNYHSEHSFHAFSGKMISVYQELLQCVSH